MFIFLSLCVGAAFALQSLKTWDGCLADESHASCMARFNERGDKIVAAEYAARGARLLQPGKGGGGGSTTTSTNARAASLLGGVGSTTVAGTDPYWTTISFPSGTTIAGPFEAGFDSEIDTLLTWLGCSPASNGYLAGGIDTQTSLELVAYNCSITLPRIDSKGDFVSLMWASGAHSPPNSAKCTSPPGSLSGYTACSNPSYHFHQNFTCLYNYGTGAIGHSTKVGVTTPSSTSITARNIYGKFEAGQFSPTDLDSCNGHFGYTPESPSTMVYHHHVTDNTPFAVGCYGPSATGGLVSITDCRSYYAGCTSSNVVTLRSGKGWFQYTKWCPCHDNVTNSNVYPSPATLYYPTYELMLAAAATAASGTSTTTVSSSSATASATATATATATLTASPSSTPSSTGTITPSTTPAVALSITASGTPTPTYIFDASVTSTPTPSSTTAVAGGAAVTGTPTPSSTLLVAAGNTTSSSTTPTPSGTRTPSRSPTASLTLGISPSSSPTVPATPSPTMTPWPSSTQTPTPSLSGTPSVSLGATPSPTQSLTPSSSTITVSSVQVSLQFAGIPATTSTYVLGIFLGIVRTWLGFDAATTPSSYAAYTDSAGAHAGWQFTFTTPISSSRQLAGTQASLDALVSSRLSDGSLILAVQQAGVSTSLGFDSPTSLINAAVAVPAKVLVPVVSVTPSATPNPSLASSSSSSNSNVAIGAGVGLGVGIPVLLAIIYYIRVNQANPTMGNKAATLPPPQASGAVSVRLPAVGAV